MCFHLSNYHYNHFINWHQYKKLKLWDPVMKLSFGITIRIFIAICIDRQYNCEYGD